MENPFEEQKNRPQRPTFLLVICILTFISSGWSVLSNLFSIFTAGLMDSSMQLEQYSNVMGEIENNDVSSFLSGFLNSSMEVLQALAAHAQEIAVLGLVLNLVSLIGAILMFQLRRLGFYLYVTAQILALFVIPYFAGFSTLVIVGIAGSALMSVIFIAMYAVNLKYMR